MDRRKTRQFLSENAGYVDFLIWLDRKFKSPILNYKGLARIVKSILAEPLALIAKGGEKCYQAKKS